MSNDPMCPMQRTPRGGPGSFAASAAVTLVVQAALLSLTICELSACDPRAKPAPVPSRDAVAGTEHGSPARDVTLSAVAAYFEAAAPNPDLTRERLMYVLEAKEKYGLSFEQDVSCRDQLCRSVLTLPDEDEARRLRKVPRPAGTDAFVVAERVDMRNVYVTVFSTPEGVAIKDLIASPRATP